MPRLVGLTRVRPLLDLATIAIGFAVLGVACGTGASPPPVPTVEPTVAPEPVAAVNPTGTVASAAVAPAQAPASVFQFPATRTPRPTPTPIPRAEGDMTAATLYDHRATLLEDGRVLVTGGHAATTPSHLSWPVWSRRRFTTHLPAAGRRPAPRSRDAEITGAVLLEDGSVLVSGGLIGEWETGGADVRVVWLDSIASAEVYDPSTETWSLVDDMPEETGLHSLEMLENGAVVVVGGFGESAALYDPISRSWAVAGGATSRELETRLWHTGALLADGNVLLVGGTAVGGAPIDSVELYDPVTGSSSATGSMREPRVVPVATILTDGRVLVIGGAGGRRTLSSAEIYDPSSGTWSGAGEMAMVRVEHTATLLSDGRVLVVGGSASQATEIYDPSTGDWSRAASTIESRDEHTATLLKDGRVLVVGGTRPSQGQLFPTASAEVYDPVVDTWTQSTEAAR